MSRRETPRQRLRTNARIGTAAIIVAIVALYLAFAGIPFKGGYEISAVLRNSSQLKKNSPVRIAGVNVGKVSKIKRGPGNTAKVYMRIQKTGQPIHTDATVKARPRLFLEGNFFVDIQPGSPSAPKLADHGTIPLSQTATPVQFDQVLTALQSDQREDLKHILTQYRAALDNGGAEGIRDSYKPSEGAFKGLAQVSQDTQGLTRDDLSQLLKQGTTVSRALNARRGQLSGLITNFNRTVSALGAEQSNLSATTAQLAGLTREAYPALADINAALPPLRRLSRSLRPLARRLPTTLDLAEPLLLQIKGLVSKSELPPLLTTLRPTLTELRHIEPNLVTLLDKVQPVSACMNSNILPTLTSSVDDGGLSTHRPVWQELGQLNVGLASASQDFTGNGPLVRFQGGINDQLVSVGALSSLGTLFANPQNPLEGSRPAKPDAPPPFHPEVACSTQGKPNLAAKTTGAPTQTPAQTQPFGAQQVTSLLSSLTGLGKQEIRSGKTLSPTVVTRTLRRAAEKKK